MNTHPVNDQSWLHIDSMSVLLFQIYGYAEKLLKITLLIILTPLILLNSIPLLLNALLSGCTIISMV